MNDPDESMKMLLNLFYSQIKDQCEYVLAAAKDIDAALRWIEDARAERDAALDKDSSDPAAFDERRQAMERYRAASQAASDRLWFALQNFVAAAANISKLLWGKDGRKHPVDREPLRAFLRVTDDSVLRPRDIRNHFEHIDERLEEWFAMDASHIHIDKTLGPVGSIHIEEGSPKSFFREFDPATAQLRFWGEFFDLRTIVAEVARILPTAKARAEKPWWED